MPKNFFCKKTPQVTNCNQPPSHSKLHQKVLHYSERRAGPKVVVTVKAKPLFSFFEPEKENCGVSYPLAPENEESVCIPQLTQATEECTSISSEDRRKCFIKKKRPRESLSEEKNLFSSGMREDTRVSLTTMNYIDSEYPDTDYCADLLIKMKDTKHRFMYRNFSSAYDKTHFYQHIKLKSRKRKNAHLKFNPISQNQPNQSKAQQGRDLKEKPQTPLPICKWKPPQDEELSDEEYHFFIQHMKDIWPSAICEMRIDYLLEYLMLNNYKTEHCFNQIDACIMFFLQKINNITVSSEEIPSNKYALRNKMKY